MSQPTIIGGRYELLSRLGAGGMAVVYRARDNRLAREVAIKVLRKEAVSTKDATMFHREARAIAALRHFNIIQIYDFSGPEESPSYLVMEVIDGLTLEALVEKRGPLPEAAALLIGRAIASAVEHAHERGVIHRDIKPANILIETTGRVLLTDFGIAKPFRDPKQLGATVVARNTGLLGTPAFMAPEQIAEEPVGPAVDVFSLGSLFHYMLVGSSPFRADDDVVEILRRILDVEYTSAKKRRPEISAGFLELIDPCLRRNPAARQTAAELSQRCSRLVRKLELGDSQRALARYLETGAVPIAEVTEVATTTHFAVPSGRVPQAPAPADLELTTQPLGDTFRAPAVHPLRWWAVGALLSTAIAVAALFAWWSTTRPAPITAPTPVTTLEVPVPPTRLTSTPPIAPPITPPITEPIAPPITEPIAAAPPVSAPITVAPPTDPALDASAPTPPARPTKRKRGAKAEEKAAPAQDGQIEVNVRPWGQITIDGVAVGNTPIVRVVPLAPGKHTISVTHPALGTQQQSFVLRAGERRVLSFDLQGQ